MAGQAVAVKGAKETRIELLGLTGELSTRIIRAMSRIAYNTMMVGAHQHSKTGVLRGSLVDNELNSFTHLVGHDTDRAPYAQFVIHGAVAHRIVPRRVQWLRYWHGSGWVFRKSVWHPGYKGDNYLERAADDAIRQFDSIVTTAIKESA